MRELTKSLFSFSWAMSLFGMGQMARMFIPGRDVSGSLDAVTRATEDQFDGVLRSLYQSGDSLQRGMVDATFSLLTPQRLSGPGGAMGNDWMRAGMGLMQQSLDLFNRTMGRGMGMMGTGGRGCGGCGGGQDAPTGWGPVPPPPRPR